MALCIASLIIGNLAALPQRDSRRLLALSGVGHMGLLLIALIAGTPQALGALAFYGLAYVVTNMGAMLVVTALRDSEGSGDVDALNGLSQRSPALGLAMLLFLPLLCEVTSQKPYQAQESFEQYLNDLQIL